MQDRNIGLDENPIITNISEGNLTEALSEYSHLIPQKNNLNKNTGGKMLPSFNTIVAIGIFLAIMSFISIIIIYFI